MEFCERDSYLSKELIKERERFFTTTPDLYYKTFEEINSVEHRFADYYIFTCVSQYYETSPLEVFLSKNLFKYNKKDQNILLGFRNDIFGIFNIIKVVVGSYFIAKNLPSDQEYKVWESNTTYQIKEGDHIVGRILPYETDYALCNFNILCPKDFTYSLKRLRKNDPYEIIHSITPLMIEEEFFHKYQNFDLEESSLEFVEKKLKYFLKKYLGRKAPSIKNIRKKINKKTDPFPLMRELSGKFNFPSNDELIEFQKIFMDFWNLSSRDEFQGKSPQEINEQSMGFRERELILDLMHCIQSNINPNNFSNQEELDKAIKKYQDEWLQQPQEELNHKTPWEVILDERKKLGSTRKSFNISMTMTPLSYGMKEEYIDLTNLSKKDSPLAEDLETFVNYFIENKVKVTLKNRWIPFKHIKSIEEDFINKDSFTSLGEEEKRGEEVSKRYIYFIDLLSRAAKFIYTDKKRWIKVNVSHFKEFSEKSYGEKLFELFFIWVKKANWTKFLASRYWDIQAKEYQNNFIAILCCIDEFKVNREIDLEEFVIKLYVPEKKEIKFSKSVLSDLASATEIILIEYLQWLGVVRTQKGEIFPGIKIKVIKKFWITPKGKKLINKMIDYYIKTGRM
jgi:hypothetical protein